MPDIHKPINPDDEDDIVPDQRAVMGIQRATQPKREPVWKDLDLKALLDRGPSIGTVSAAGPSSTGARR